MDKKEILELLRKHRKGTATTEEISFLIKLYELFASETDVTDLMDADEKEKLKQDIQTAIWENIQRKKANNVMVMKHRYLPKIAAAVFVLVFAAGVLLFSQHPQPQNNVAQHKKIDKGSNIFMVLPDGSRVIMSYNSKLTYAAGFASLPKREVYLSGQAYFDIKHDAARPFIVHTGHLFTTVLGTAFNIKALPGDKVITVTVTRGRVKVSNENKLLGVIVPNQQIVYNDVAESATKTHIRALAYTGWTTENSLYLEDVTVAEAARLFEERFKVKIVFGDDDIKNKHFTASFDTAASLDQALRSTCAFNNATYSYNQERTLITINSKPIN